MQKGSRNKRGTLAIGQVARMNGTPNRVLLQQAFGYTELESV